MNSLVILMGSPGSGKTTIAKSFSEKTENFYCLSIGEIMRGEMKMTPPFPNFDRSELLRIVLDKFNSSKKDSLIVDFNPYPPETWNVLTESLFKVFKNVFFFEIVSSYSEDRLKNRKRSDESNNFDYKERLKYFYDKVYPEIENITNRSRVINDDLDTAVNSIILKVCQS